MSSWDALGLVLVFIGLPAFAFFLARVGYRRRESLLAVAGGRWNARVRWQWSALGNRLDILVDDVKGEITFAESGRHTVSEGWTRVRFNWPSERRLRVTPEGWGSRIRRILGSHEIAFDDPFFDDKFWVESSHPRWARELLGPQSRQDLQRLRTFPAAGSPYDVTLDVGPAGVALKVTRVLIDDSLALGSFVELAISILQKARGAVEAAGIALESVRPGSKAACPICGHGVEEQLLHCPACRTPHHRDCWKYAGGCAIFGCASRVRKSV